MDHNYNYLRQWHLPPKDAGGVVPALVAAWLQDRDHIKAALANMHGKTKVMPKFAYIAGIGCFPNELKAEVEKLFPDKWLPGAITSIGGEGITEITGLTTADKDVEIISILL